MTFALPLLLVTQLLVGPGLPSGRQRVVVPLKILFAGFAEEKPECVDRDSGAHRKLATGEYRGNDGPDLRPLLSLEQAVAGNERG